MWTPAALSSEARPYGGDLWRVVEAQHRAATMRIVDTLEEQAVLEALIEEAKPPLPPAAEGLHYLLAAPFRYRPYPAGSRFRRAGLTPGVFYASETVETALAELAFRRLLFLAKSPEMAAPARPVEHTAFRIACRAERALDLTAPPLDRDRAAWEHVSDYPPCQDLPRRRARPSRRAALPLGARPRRPRQCRTAEPRGVRGQGAAHVRDLGGADAPRWRPGQPRVSAPRGAGVFGGGFRRRPAAGGTGIGRRRGLSCRR